MAVLLYFRAAGFPVRTRLGVTVLLLTAALLCGCGEHRAETRIGEAILPAAEVARGYVLDREWWRLYGDSRLDALVGLAQDRNLDLARSAIRVNRALYQARLIGADLLPSFSAEGEGSATHDLDARATSRSFHSRVDLRYELDLWQRLRHAASAQAWEHAATIEDLAAARLALVHAVVDGYFNMRRLNQAVVVTSQSVARYEDLARLVRIKHQTGKVGLLEELQAEQALLSARDRLASLQAERAEAESILRDLLNLHPTASLDIGSADLLAAPDAPVSLDAPVAALAARPDIHAAEARFQANFRAMEAERASWYPRITLGTALGASSSRTSDYFDAPFALGSVRISFPLLDWNRIRWKVKIAEADYEQARLDFTGAVTTALNEVQAARAAGIHGRLALAALVARHEKDRQVSFLYRDRYQLGAAEFKDYLEALVSEDSSLLNALNAKYTLLMADNLVYRAMGGRYTPR